MHHNLFLWTFRFSPQENLSGLADLRFIIYKPGLGERGALNAVKDFKILRLHHLVTRNVKLANLFLGRKKMKTLKSEWSENSRFKW